MTRTAELLAILNRLRAALLTVGLLTTTAPQACDLSPPPRSPEQPTQGQNPCPGVTTLSSTAFRSSLRVIDKRAGIIDGDGAWTVLDSIWNHRSATARGLLRPLVAR